MVHQIVFVLICGVIGLTRSLTMSANPGLTIRLSQAGLHYAANVAIDQMVSEVQGQDLPNLNGEDNVSIGKVNYEISSMKVTGFTRPASTVTVNAEQGITWSLSGAAISVHGDWRYKFRKKFVKISDHGSFDVTVKRVSLTVAIAMGSATDGRPTISMASCNSDVGDVDVKFHGGASWLYNLFRHAVENPIEKALERMLCKSVQKAIDEDAKNSLATMKIQVPVGDNLLLDYRLVASPKFGIDFVESQHKGEFLWKEDHKEAPFQPEPMSQTAGADKMVTFCLSAYVMNTLGQVMHEHDHLQYNLTKADLKEKDCDLLNTNCPEGTCLGSFMPMIANKYPEGSVELAMKTTSPPRLSIEDSKIKGIFGGEINFSVRLPDKSLQNAFTAQMNANFTIVVKMTDDKVKADVKAFRFSVSKIDSDIGNIPERVMEFYFNLAANQFIIPKLKEIGENGIQMPSIDNVDFVNSELILLDGALCFTTDAQYQRTG